MVKQLPVSSGIEVVNLDLGAGVVIKVEQGTGVKQGLAIGEKQAEKKVYDLVKLFGIKSKKTKGVVKLKVGEMVKAGDLLAKKKGLLSAKKIISHVDGKVIGVDDGKLVIEIVNSSEEVLSPLSGKVAGVSGGSVDIELSGEMVEGVWAGGEKNWGRLHVLEADESGEVSLESVRGDLRETIVVINNGLQRGLWYKLCALGVNGVICPSVPKDFGEWVNSEEDEDSLGKLKQAVLVINESVPEMQLTEGESNKDHKPEVTKPTTNQIQEPGSGFAPNQSQGHGSGFTAELWSWFNKRVGRVAVINVGEKKLLISND